MAMKCKDALREAAGVVRQHGYANARRDNEPVTIQEALRQAVFNDRNRAKEPRAEKYVARFLEAMGFDSIEDWEAETNRSKQEVIAVLVGAAELASDDNL